MNILQQVEEHLKHTTNIILWTRRLGENKIAQSLRKRTILEQTRTFYIPMNNFPMNIGFLNTTTKTQYIISELIKQTLKKTAQALYKHFWTTHLPS